MYFHPAQIVIEIAKIIDSLVREYSHNPRKSAEFVRERAGFSLTSSVPWHLREVDAIIAELNTSKNSGLSQTAVQENLRQYGINALIETEPRSEF